MNRFILAFSIVFVTNIVVAQQNFSSSDTTTLQTLEINSTRANDLTPVTKTNLDKKTIEKNNIGRDLPFILNQTPSVQVNADAGNGIGYTGIRIRGTDATRINISINGIPYNDAESQGTFFVNLPDLASTANSIQIQRGVGTSTNGTGAFGGTININTNETDSQRYIVLNNAIGSYRSMKNTFMINSGLVKKHFLFTGRLSNISSNGYVDRSQSKLQSFYTSSTYIDNKQSLRLNIFSGKEKTNAAWFGINQATLDTNRTYNPAGTEKPGTPYDNQTDNYTQTHYQLFYNRKINKKIQFNLTGFLTKGKGYFEEYKAGQLFSDYGLPNVVNGADTIYNSDLIRQLWLDNKFYGIVFSSQYSNGRTNITFGGTANQYDGNHFGKIISTIVPNAAPAGYEWYRLTATKKEISAYTKWIQQLNNKWSLFADLQLRNVNYVINGFRNNPEIVVNNKYLFFNPKAGITYKNKGNKIYFSVAKAAKEPNRDDFETASNEKPNPEKLLDFEAGFEHKKNNNYWGLNVYLMNYKDQLVLTGKVNDVYAYTRTNIPKSYRVGIEMEGLKKVNKWLSISENFNLSINKVKDFTEYVDDYDNGIQIVNHYTSTDISYSPSVIGACSVIANPIKNTSFTLNSKYVGKQYLDNTSNASRQLNAYFIQDLRIDYDFKLKKKRQINLFLQINNLYSAKYAPNGYTFSYVYGGAFTTENYYYPMATVNVMGGLNVRF
jgi:iron complex outermembrane receptor protein